MRSMLQGQAEPSVCYSKSSCHISFHLMRSSASDAVNEAEAILDWKFQMSGLAWCNSLRSVHCFYILAHIFPLFSTFSNFFSNYFHYIISLQLLYSPLSLYVLVTVVTATWQQWLDPGLVAARSERLLAGSWQTVNLLCVTLQSKGKHICTQSSSIYGHTYTHTHLETCIQWESCHRSCWF